MNSYPGAKEKIVGAIATLLSRVTESVTEGVVDAGLEEAQDFVEEATRRIVKARGTLAKRKRRRRRIVVDTE